MNYFAVAFTVFYIVKLVSVYSSNYEYWENKAFGANSVRVIKNKVN